MARCTVDLDQNNLDHLHHCIWEGVQLFGAYPNEVRTGNTKGFHVIWRGVREELAWFHRARWDDPRRVRMDLESEMRPQQVLFTRKLLSKHGEITTEGESVRWR